MSQLSTQQMIPAETDGITKADITDALDVLKYARMEGDKLKIALAEASLNDLIDRYSYHGCHGSQPERERA